MQLEIDDNVIYVKTEIKQKIMYMGLCKNSDTPKWMVKIMENPIKMDDLGGKPTIFGNIHIGIYENAFSEPWIFPNTSKTVHFQRHFDVARQELCSMGLSILPRC